MKLLVVFASTIAIALAEAQGGYSGGSGGGSSQFSAGGSFNFGSGFTTGGSGNQGGFSDSSQGTDASQQGPQVFRYVSVHTAPEDPDDQATKTVRVPGGQNKHVNIIFVKTPSNGADQKTEIVLPEQDEQKNLVYVLVQKTDSTSNLKIKKPQPTKPSKPEVYFIRYKNGQQAGQASGAGGFNGDASAPGVPSAGYGSPSPAYGSPF